MQVGTVGQAVNELNNEDYGNRTFILVSNNESNICQDVTAVRLNKTTYIFLFEIEGVFMALLEKIYRIEKELDNPSEF